MTIYTFNSLELFLVLLGYIWALVGLSALTDTILIFIKKHNGRMSPVKVVSIVISTFTLGAISVAPVLIMIEVFNK
jgi:hypothetical protein